MDPSPAPLDPCMTRTDLASAALLQRALLPPSPFAYGTWRAAHHFEPSREVGGDIVDLVPAGDRLYFVFADVSGKGVPAALLTAHIHGAFRALIPFGLPVEELVARASALLCESTLPGQYATLVCGYVGPDDEAVLANAGHLPPLVLSAGAPSRIVATGTPIGLFCDSSFGTTRVTLAPGDTLLMFSDGLTEALDAAGDEYGLERVQDAAAAAAAMASDALVEAIVADHRRFARGVSPADDLTLLAIRREFEAPSPK